MKQWLTLLAAAALVPICAHAAELPDFGSPADAGHAVRPQRAGRGGAPGGAAAILARRALPGAGRCHRHNRSHHLICRLPRQAIAPHDAPPIDRHGNRT